MKRNENWLSALIILLAIVLIALYTGYSHYYLPRAKAYSTYLEIYQEYGEDEIKSISITSINHQVVVKKSNTDKIKIDYYQKAENSNNYSVNNGILTLDIIERGEEVDNLLFSSEKKINIITIYIPENKQLSFTYDSVQGTTSIGDVVVGKISVTNVTGNITIAGVESNTISVSTNGGDVLIDNSLANIVQVSNVSGGTKIKINDYLNEFNCDLKTNYGTITLNGVYPTIVDEEGNEIITKVYKTEAGTNKKLTISTIRSSIIIDTLIAEEQQPESEEQNGD